MKNFKPKNNMSFKEGKKTIKVNDIAIISFIGTVKLDKVTEFLIKSGFEQFKIWFVLIN